MTLVHILAFISSSHLVLVMLSSSWLYKSEQVLANRARLSKLGLAQI
jgi:hypothetical protein